MKPPPPLSLPAMPCSLCLKAGYVVAALLSLPPAHWGNAIAVCRPTNLRGYSLWPFNVTWQLYQNAQGERSRPREVLSPQRRASGLAGVAAAVCLPAFLFRGGRLRGPFHRRASQAGCAPCAGPLPGQFVAPAKLCTPAPEVPSLSPCPPAATASPQAGTVASNRTSSNRGSWNLLALQVWREWGPAPRPAVAFPAAARTPPAGGVVPRPAPPAHREAKAPAALPWGACFPGRLSGPRLALRVAAGKLAGSAEGAGS